jgi:NAD(P)-dependent dehydrogenase (short-subunit alcohol dehydrogenase family)
MHLRLLLSFLLLISVLKMSNSLARTILITGATDGIGQHTARKLAADGNFLLVHGRRSDAGAELVEDLKKRGAKDVQYFNADLADLDQVDQLANEVMQKVDSIDVLINNAGVFDPTPMHSVQGYDMTLAVNVMAPFSLTRKLLFLIANSKDDCPRIITTSSISQSSTLSPLDELFATGGKVKSAHRAYSDSKLGDLMITTQLAKILNAQNSENYDKIKCLSMDPGTVNTKMLLAGWGRCG